MLNSFLNLNLADLDNMLKAVGAICFTLGYLLGVVFGTWRAPRVEAAA